MGGLPSPDQPSPRPTEELPTFVLGHCGGRLCGRHGREKPPDLIPITEEVVRVINILTLNIRKPDTFQPLASRPISGRPLPPGRFSGTNGGAGQPDFQACMTARCLQAKEQGVHGTDPHLTFRATAVSLPPKPEKPSPPTPDDRRRLAAGARGGHSGAHLSGCKISLSLARQAANLGPLRCARVPAEAIRPWRDGPSNRRLHTPSVFMRRSSARIRDLRHQLPGRISPRF